MISKTHKYISWFGVAVIVAVSPLWKGGARIPPLTFILLISYVLIFIWLWRVNNGGGYKFKRTSLDIPIFLFAVLAVISLFFSIYKHDSVYALIKMFCYIGIYYLIVNEFDRDMIRRMLSIVITMGVALSIYGILQHLNLLNHSWWDPKEFMAATFVNHNHFSGYLELVIPITVSFIIIKRYSARRLLMVAALIVMTTAFLIAQSRGAWISLSISLLFMMFLITKERSGGIKSMIIPVLIAIVIATLAYFGRDMINERVSGSISATETAGGSFMTRMKMWQGSLDMIKHNPLVGTGIGTFIWGFPRYRPEGLNGLVNFAHNDYLQAACEIGIPALIVMLGIIFIVLKSGLKRENADSYRLGCAIGVLSLSIHALSDFNFHIPANMLLFVVYLGIIMRARD